jgi:hypothetical protein
VCTEGVMIVVFLYQGQDHVIKSYMIQVLKNDSVTSLAVFCLLFVVYPTLKSLSCINIYENQQCGRPC